jgi:hypothetical protein
MYNIYYIIWADFIINSRKYHPHEEGWKFTTWFLMSTMHAFNFWIIVMWLKYFKIYDLPLLNLDIFPGTALNDVFSFSIEFMGPFGLLNYLLIFYNNRYEKILPRYKNKKDIKYGLIYSLSMIGLSLFTFCLYGILTSQH